MRGGRRRAIFPGIHTIFIVALVALVPGIASGEDWPSWRGPRGDGTWKGPRLPAKWPDGGLKPVWRQPLEGGYAGIAVAQDRVYAMDRRKLPADRKPAKDEDGHERVLCFEAADGKLLWSYDYPTRYGDLGGYSNGPRAMPIVHDGRVYTLGAVGHCHCFDAATGKLLWARDMVKESQARVPEWGFAASPVIDEERLIVHTGAQPDGCLIALERHTGKEIWRSLPDPAGYCTPILIHSRAGRQLVAWTPENIRGLDPNTGKLFWTVPYKVTYGVSIAAPIFRDDIVFVTGYWEGARAIRLGKTLTDAELIWEERRQLRGIMAQPLYRDGHVFSIDRTAGLVCFELKTGKKLWDDHRLTPPGRNPHASMIWINDADRALILNSVGELILSRLTPKGYEEQARTKIIDGAVWTHPAYAGRHIYLRNDGGERAPKSAGPFELVCVELVE